MKVVDNWGQGANENARTAILLDSMDRKAAAIAHYRQAINALDKLAHIYPDYHLNRIWMERANAYQNRIKAIERAET